MQSITNFDPGFTAQLPETHTLLTAANLVVHDGVSRVTLHGSRGMAGGYRPGSDVDLSLLIDAGCLPPPGPAQAAYLREVLQTTLDHWRDPAEADLAALFATRANGLALFDLTHYDPQRCPDEAKSGFGLFKVQKGFDGYVSTEMLDLEKMYPCVTVWRR
jgi:hypothetical protein